MKRRKSRVVRIGRIAIGENHPIAIQSMTKVRTGDVDAVLGEIACLERCGCDIVRVAVKDMDDARAIRAIKRRTRIPIVADIHFDHRLAVASIEAGADKVRINPGNMPRREDVARVVSAAKSAGIPIRVGVNSGSVRRGRMRTTASDLFGAVRRQVRILERLRFRDIVLSLKAADVPTTIDAYRHAAAGCEYPLHLGVTASGPREDGIVRSAVGIGSLLAEGIGDTIRVSLTAPAADEIVAAKRILSAAGRRSFGPTIVSCPTCGRCQVDLVKIVDDLERAVAAARDKLPARASRLTVAVMGCEVNGPGEAEEADLGIAAGKGAGALFVNGKIVKRVAERDFVKAIMQAMYAAR